MLLVERSDADDEDQTDGLGASFGSQLADIDASARQMATLLDELLDVAHHQGVGIPAADRERVFERFFRAGNVGSIAGSGIGLAGARHIAEQHGGTLTVESGEGVGSTFTLRLPL